MDKTKLAICIEDEEYESRFVKCVMKHYKESYEIHVFDSMKELAQMQNEKFPVVITGDGNELQEKGFENSVLFVLQERVIETASSLKENVIYTEKYQEVYKIMEELEKVVTQKHIRKSRGIGSGQKQLIGVFSVEKESMQMPFSALLAEILGEKTRVLVVDIQPFSGFSIEQTGDEEVLGMEDLMTVATTGNYTSNRLAASIGHEQKWDYIYPVRNAQCLVEAEGGLYQEMIGILQQERGYEQVIINFGTVFPGMMELLNQCQQVYFLTDRTEERTWREEHFLQEVRNQGREEFLRKFIWMEVPAHFVKERSWRQLVKAWLWSELGDKLREINWMENGDGTNM